MNTDKILRQQIIKLINKSEAHMDFDETVKNFPMDHINDKFTNGTYTFWHLLEHIRITQSDILNFIVNRNYKDLEWPKDYWPAASEKADAKDWKKTIDFFHKDMKKLSDIIKNPKTDLYKKIEWGDGQTILREALLVADHNAYHIGEFAIMRQVMGTWRN